MLDLGWIWYALGHDEQFFSFPGWFGVGVKEPIDSFSVCELGEDGALEFFGLVDPAHTDCVYFPELGEEVFELLLKPGFLRTEPFLKRWIRLAPAVGVGTGG